MFLIIFEAIILHPKMQLTFSITSNIALTLSPAAYLSGHRGHPVGRDRSPDYHDNYHHRGGGRSFPSRRRRQHQYNDDVSSCSPSMFGSRRNLTVDADTRCHHVPLLEQQQIVDDGNTLNLLPPRVPSQVSFTFISLSPFSCR